MYSTAHVMHKNRSNSTVVAWLIKLSENYWTSNVIRLPSFRNKIWNSKLDYSKHTHNSLPAGNLISLTLFRFKTINIIVRIRFIIPKWLYSMSPKWNEETFRSNVKGQTIYRPVWGRKLRLSWTITIKPKTLNHQSLTFWFVHCIT